MLHLQLICSDDSYAFPHSSSQSFLRRATLKDPLATSGYSKLTRNTAERPKKYVEIDTRQEFIFIQPQHTGTETFVTQFNSYKDKLF